MAKTPIKQKKYTKEEVIHLILRFHLDLYPNQMSRRSSVTEDIWIKNNVK